MMHAALSLWLLSAIVCLGSGDHHREGHEDHEHHLATPLGNTNTNTSRVSLVSSASNDFSFRLYTTIAAQTGSMDNIFFSPISVTVALAALSVGARGETHEQIFSGLGLNNTSMQQADIDRAFKTLLIRSNNASQDLNAGTALFLDDNFKSEPKFLEVMKHSYQADGFTVDFAKSTESANIINRYVQEKTNGRINKLVQDLDPATVLYLISYIYYQGKWETPFNPRYTRQGIFNVDEQTKVPVQMMMLKKTFKVYHDQELSVSVLHLPLNNNSMLLLLPDNNMRKLEEFISARRITKWLRWMRSRKYTIFLPKFSIKTSYSLKDMLIGMGMTNMFDGKADFSGISEHQRLAVSEIVHQASLDVDETGATAAAATGITLTPLSSRQISVLNFNRPFMVLITDPATKTILFMGKIVNPNV